MLMQRHIPKDSVEVKRDNLPAVVYIYNAEHGVVGQPCAIAYIGKSNKPAWNFRFSNEAQRDAKINSLFEAIQAREAFKSERKATRKSFTHGYNDGDILYASWGYDQTNIEYFQVIAHTQKTVTFREIAQTVNGTGFMSGDCMPVKGQFTGPEYTRPVRPDDHKGCVHFAEHDGGYMRYLWEWDGKPKNSTWYA